DPAYLSQKLATIVTDLKVPLNLEEARSSVFDAARVEAIFRELEFRSLLPRLIEHEKRFGKLPAKKSQQLTLFGEDEPILNQAEPQPGSLRVQIVDTPEALQALVQRLSQAPAIAFDTETTSTNQMVAHLIGISLSVEHGEGYYIPVGHQEGKQLPLPVVIEALRGPMTDPHIPKVGHNLIYDYILLARNGLRASPLTFDTMIAEWLSNPISRNLGLKNLAWVRLDRKMTQIEELIGKGKDQITMDAVPIQKAAAYAVEDAEVVLDLMPLLQKDLEACQAVKLLEEVEMPLIPVLADMEMTGISLDAGYLAEMSKELNDRLAAIEEQIFKEVGEPFNINSTQQLSNILFERLKLTPPDRSRKTASGHYSTSAEILEMLQGKHPVVDWVLEYRELSKLKSTYVDALPLEVNPDTGRVHTSYSQTGAVTGRLASSDPNLQNIPTRTDLGRRVRRAFIARPGYALVSVDYSQVELRLVAHMSGDEAMLEAFRLNQDIHAATAAAIFNISIDKVSKNQRRDAKTINFGLIYGMSPFGLTRSTDLTLAEAEDFVEAYFKQFPGVKHYLDGIRYMAAQQGFVETLLGRRRYFPGLRDQHNYNQRNREEREAINAPIQGTAADIMKIAMLHVPAALKQAGLSAQMLLQVHDELVLESPVDEIERTARVVQEVMENAFQLSIPLKTEARSGPNWEEMQPLG
ncbi:MAG: DNA polymerase I, partial [Omnitrophica WOR_2 bacterium]